MVAAALAGNCSWLLFFGGVPDQTRAHAENVGVAVASSPWGPFRRYEDNPVFKYKDQTWCKSIDGGPSRVDEIKATNINGQKLFAVKSDTVLLPVPSLKL